MTPDEFNERMTNVAGLVSGDFAADTMAAPVAAILKAIKNRIVNSGLNTNEQQIGDYSTKPIYVTRDQFAKPGAFKGVGKYGFKGERVVSKNVYKVKKVNGRETIVSANKFKVEKKKPKSMYLQNGYKELRGIQTLRTDFVNLKYRGDLIKDYQMAKDAQSYVIGFTNITQSNKRLGLELHFGSNIFAPSANEIADYIGKVNFNMQRLTNGVLNGETINATVIQPSFI